MSDEDLSDVRRRRCHVYRPKRERLGYHDPGDWFQAQRSTLENPLEALIFFVETFYNLG